MKREKDDALSGIDPDEIGRFDALAAEWWDADGPMAPLHRMNPVRLEYVIQTLKGHFGALKNLNLLDVGCGGGLMAEPMARLGAHVTAIDGAAELIRIATSHAEAQKLKIDYRHALTSDLLAEKRRFDVVLALEVIEHVPDPAEFLAEIASLVKPGGMVILSTLNRSAASLAFGVIAAEHILRWLPPGTHDWRRFLKPSELFALCSDQGLQPIETMGLSYDVTKHAFRLDEENLKINYFLTATK